MPGIMAATPPPYNGNLQFRSFLRGVAFECLACGSSWILPGFAPKICSTEVLFSFKYYNLSKAHLGGTCDAYRVFGGTRACFLGFLHETQGNMGGTHSREAYVAKKPNRNDHFLQCLATRCSTCVLWYFCEARKINVFVILRARVYMSNGYAISFLIPMAQGTLLGWCNGRFWSHG